MNSNTFSELTDRFLASLPESFDPIVEWPKLVALLRGERAKSAVYLQAWNSIFAAWQVDAKGPCPIWIPTERDRSESNLGKWMKELGFDHFAQFHHWSVTRRNEFWIQAAKRLNIRFRSTSETSLDSSRGAIHPTWFPGSKLNIVESCFQEDSSKPAIVFQRPGHLLQTMSYFELRQMTNRVSNSLLQLGCLSGDAIAVVLPMTALSVPIYLGIVQAGCQVVSIADSFAPPEIATRLKIADAKWIFTYDFQIRNGKRLELFSRVAEAGSTPAIVIPVDEQSDLSSLLRAQDCPWAKFLSADEQFEPHIAEPTDAINILFSSGTTGEPKAIPWSHLTPLKCAIDGYCHQNIQPGSVCTWPTNLGWMMGPWLIFATLINRGTIGLFEEAPMGAGFGAFVESAKVNLLGVVPTIVKAWRNNGEMEQFDWSAIQAFSSTGESSQADDMAYLSSLAGVKPIIEYCGGTEIGGGYITSTVCEPNFPATFNTPAVGIDFVLLDEQQRQCDEGELFLIPPSIGFSTRLLNRDHDATYFEGTPQLPGFEVLRRHGDHFRRVDSALSSSLFQAGGRVDDTMNLGGIKISSAEIERVLNLLPGIVETAAVSFSRDGGPDELVVFVVARNELDRAELLTAMNGQLKRQLNPLFKVNAIKIVPQLPRTASGKVMRRELRKQVE
jgi:acetyl-CoA synthetase